MFFSSEVVKKFQLIVCFNKSIIRLIITQTNWTKLFV